VDDEDLIETLRATGEALNSLVDRVESLEARAKALDSVSTRLDALSFRVEGLEARVDSTAIAASKRADVLSAKAQSRDEKNSRQVTVLEKKLEQERDLVRDVKADLRMLQARVDAIANRPEPQPPQELRELHVVHHGR
jgi:hypothetical protein